MKGQARNYRCVVPSGALVGYRVTVRETDLQIYSRQAMPELARETVLALRGHLEAFIADHPAFLKSLSPWAIDTPAPPLVQAMIQAGRQAGVGPMAAVAGAVAEAVGRVLLDRSAEVIVENGGDVFLKTDTPAVVGIFAGRSPLSLKLGLRLDTGAGPMAVCTSSGTVGHSLSFGRADAACVLSPDAALADAVATAVGNQVRSVADIASSVKFARRIDGVNGVLIVCGRQMGAWGAVELVRLDKG